MVLHLAGSRKFPYTLVVVFSLISYTDWVLRLADKAVERDLYNFDGLVQGALKASLPLGVYVRLWPDDGSLIPACRAIELSWR